MIITDLNLKFRMRALSKLPAGHSNKGYTEEKHKDDTKSTMLHSNNNQFCGPSNEGARLLDRKSSGKESLKDWIIDVFCPLYGVRRDFVRICERPANPSDGSHHSRVDVPFRGLESRHHLKGSDNYKGCLYFDKF